MTVAAVLAAPAPIAKAPLPKRHPTKSKHAPDRHLNLAAYAQKTQQSLREDREKRHLRRQSHNQREAQENVAEYHQSQIDNYEV
tara:strand:- start:32 stop:283 length:252 start_codon:yes stop_codon:yes gene_type:complete